MLPHLRTQLQTARMPWNRCTHRRKPPVLQHVRRGGTIVHFPHGTEVPSKRPRMSNKRRLRTSFPQKSTLPLPPSSKYPLPSLPPLIFSWMTFWGCSSGIASHHLTCHHFHLRPSLPSILTMASDTSLTRLYVSVAVAVVLVTPPTYANLLRKQPTSPGRRWSV